jgi:parallel beta-helix repeat protein
MKMILCVVVALAFASSVVADTINVPAGGDIQAAIDGASDGDIIQLEAGEYFPAATIDTLGKAVTLRGVAGKGKDGAPTSIIDGQDSIRVLICDSGEGPGTVFENLLITGGYTKGTGGGMLNNGSSSPMLTDCTFMNNSADNYGGGMNNSSSSPILENCTFEGNSAVSGGGGMYNRNNSSPTLIDCTFEGNSAEDYGGGMYNYDSSSPTLSDCTFTDNSVSYGGGMYNSSSSSPTLSGCVFTGNSADIYGGGMRNYLDSSPALAGTTVCNNTPDQINGDWIDNSGNCVQESCDDCQDCVGDFNADGQVNGGDLGVFLVEWGACTDCAADFNDDGFVDGIDLGLFLVAWGPCP